MKLFKFSSFVGFVLLLVSYSAFAQDIKNQFSTSNEYRACKDKRLNRFYNSVGAGTEDKPYEIYNEAQFRHFASNGAESGFYFIQCRSISFNYSNSQGEFFINKFKSFYNGNNHSLINFKLSDGYGLIKVINSGWIKNLTLSNFEVGKLVQETGGSGIKMGILGGMVENFFNVENITIKNSVLKSNKQFQFSHVGGLVGLVFGGISVNKASIINTKIEFNHGQICGGLIGQIVSPSVLKNIHISNGKGASAQKIKCKRIVGGLAGIISKTKVENVLVETKIENGATEISSQSDYFGGLVGRMEDSVISKGESRSMISVGVSSVNKSFVIGGLVGSLDSAKISYSLNRSEIILTNQNPNTCAAETGIGGIAGVMKNNSIIEWSRSEKTNISVHNFFGGIGGVVGKIEAAQISNTFGQTHFKLSGDLAIEQPYLGGFVGLIFRPVGTQIVNSYSDFTYELSPSSKLVYSGGFVGMISCNKKLDSNIFKKTIATMNGFAGGVIPKPFAANNPSDEGKFLAYVHPSCEFDAPSALDDLAINYLESMSCNNDDDLYCNLGVKHSAEEIFNVQTGPVKNWNFGPDNWVVDGQSNFLTIPKSGSIIPQYVN